MSILQPMHGYYLEDLSVGMSAVFGKTVTEADIMAFAGVSGDTNPIHLHADFAKASRFGERIAHGMLSASFISTVVGTRLPGPGSIYVSQSLNFKAPVKIDDVVVTTVKLIELVPEKKRARFETVCSVGGKPVLTGEAVLMIPARPAA